MNFPEQLIEPFWFQANYPDWVLVYRNCSQNDFYFLYHIDRPREGVIWFVGTNDFRLERIRVSDIPQGIIDHIKHLNLHIYVNESLPISDEGRSDYFIRSRHR